MIDVRELDALQIDALREVANIGAGHAATALSQMTNRRIGVNVPEIRIVRLEDVPELVALLRDGLQGAYDEHRALAERLLDGDLAG